MEGTCHSMKFIFFFGVMYLLLWGMITSKCNYCNTKFQCTFLNPRNILPKPPNSLNGRHLPNMSFFQHGKHILRNLHGVEATTQRHQPQNAVPQFWIDQSLARRPRDAPQNSASYKHFHQELWIGHQTRTLQPEEDCWLSDLRVPERSFCVLWCKKKWASY